ncbi:transcriptional repressor [Leucobacter sp. CSA2]|uniref:Transcriptional repressor n=1 Tax=Leucobacter edaphi TaxID=2796472 RepID=A0A934UX77_9MICO|nr:transcriptional repressor [Leucobacter edaphi]MBK0421311.1 transcriptional repressor [Leucobacter edaphi]
MSTIQTRAVISALHRLGHASNLALHEELATELPELSLTSLHRITARLSEAGKIGTVPSDGRTIVLDARPEPHDHFACVSCGGIVDIELPAATLAAIQQQLGAHLAEAGLVVRGRCAACREGDAPLAATSLRQPPERSE